MKTADALVFRSFGKPEEVCEWGQRELPALSEGQVRLRVLMAPLNPADMNFVQGNYGVVPELPAHPGMESVAEVVESEDASLSVGDRVICVKRLGTWCRELVCEASDVLVVRKDLPVEQAAMLKVNPLTAWCMLKVFVQLSEGDAVVQNAANSSVGQCLIQLAREWGLKTMNVVRREGLEEELKALGADHVFVDHREVAKDIAACCERKPQLAINAVGGDSALHLMAALGKGGTHVTYGAMSLKSLKVPNGFLIFRDLILRGFWVTEWMKSASRQELEQAYGELADLVVAGKLTQQVAKVYAAEEWKEALTHAQEGQRGGKILLDWR